MPFACVFAAADSGEMQSLYASRRQSIEVCSKFGWSSASRMRGPGVPKRPNGGMPSSWALGYTRKAGVWLTSIRSSTCVSAGLAARKPAWLASVRERANKCERARMSSPQAHVQTLRCMKQVKTDFEKQFGSDLPEFVEPWFYSSETGSVAAMPKEGTGVELAAAAL